MDEPNAALPIPFLRLSELSGWARARGWALIDAFAAMARKGKRKISFGRISRQATSQSAELLIIIIDSVAIATTPPVRTSKDTAVCGDTRATPRAEPFLLRLTTQTSSPKPDRPPNTTTATTQWAAARPLRRSNPSTRRSKRTRRISTASRTSRRARAPRRRPRTTWSVRARRDQGKGHQ